MAVTWRVCARTRGLVDGGLEFGSIASSLPDSMECLHFELLHDCRALRISNGARGARTFARHAGTRADAWRVQFGPSHLHSPSDFFSRRLAGPVAVSRTCNAERLNLGLA